MGQLVATDDERLLLGEVRRALLRHALIRDALDAERRRIPSEVYERLRALTLAPEEEG